MSDETQRHAPGSPPSFGFWEATGSILSGGTDTERWPEPRPGGPPIDWIARALAGDMIATGERSVGGAAGGAGTEGRVGAGGARSFPRPSAPTSGATC